MPKRKRERRKRTHDQNYGSREAIHTLHESQQTREK
jgi:hypothetical protein